MIAFWTFLFYLSTAFFVFSLLYLIYEKFKNKDGFKGVIFFVSSFILVSFSENRICNSIIDELISDIRTNRLILEKNNFVTKTDLLTLKHSSQRRNYYEKKYGVKVLPSKEDLFFKKDFVNNKYWLYYTKYSFSRKIAVGYIELK